MAKTETKALPRPSVGWPALSALLFAFLLGCQAAPTAPTPELLPDFEVIAPYPATLAYALDGAGGRSRHDPGYRDWVVESGDPAWLKEFRRAREEMPAQRDDGDGFHDPYLNAAYSCDSLEQLRAEVRRLAPEDCRAPMLRALDHADRRVRPHFERQRLELEEVRSALIELSKEASARQLFRELRHSCGLAPDHALNFRVVLVAKPRGPQSFAHHQGRNLVMEWRPGQDPRSILGVLFHEIAHLAVHHSQAVPQLEASLIGAGVEGAIAGNYWNEAYATSFGNGYAASRLNPQFREEQGLYADPTIEALGRFFYRRWAESRPPQLGAQLGAQMIEAVNTAWPAQKWTLGNLIFRQAVYADDSEALQHFIAASGSSWTSAQTPLPSRLSIPPGIPASVPRVFLVLRSTLLKRSDLRELCGVKTAEVYAQLAAAPSRWHLSLDSPGVASLLLVARDPVALRQACQALDAQRPLGRPGWFDS